MQVVAKIESIDSIPNLHEIAAASDVLMVARGDLGECQKNWRLYTQKNEWQRACLRLSSICYDCTVPIRCFGGGALCGMPGSMLLLSMGAKVQNRLVSFLDPHLDVLAPRYLCHMNCNVICTAFRWQQWGWLNNTTLFHIATCDWQAVAFWVVVILFLSRWWIYSCRTHCSICYVICDTSSPEYHIECIQCLL